MKRISVSRILAMGLVLIGVTRGAVTENNPFQTPYRYYNYGDWIDEERFNLDYEMRVPGYTYYGDMVFADYSYRDDRPDPDLSDSYGMADGDWIVVDTDYEDWYYDDDDDDDSGWYDYDPSEPVTGEDYFGRYSGISLNGENGDIDFIADDEFIDGDAGPVRDYYTDDWYEYGDDFSEWYKSL